MLNVWSTANFLAEPVRLNVAADSINLNLIDDITIKDLNTEIKQTGATWKDPVVEDDDEEVE